MSITIIICDNNNNYYYYHHRPGGLLDGVPAAQRQSQRGVVYTIYKQFILDISSLY